VVLKGVPAGVTPAEIALALKVQDFDVPEACVQPLGPTAMVELRSEADRKSLLELGSLVIKKVKVRVVVIVVFFFFFFHYFFLLPYELMSGVVISDPLCSICVDR
jgi:hypothetical protein